MRDLAAATAFRDKCVQQLIIDDLADWMPALDAKEEAAEKRLSAACAALEGPERHVVGLNDEIARAEAELATWRSQLEGGDVASRVTARQWIAEWEAEREALVQKRDFAVADMSHLVDAKAKAHADAELAKGAKMGLAAAMVNPFGSPVARTTPSYIGYRQPFLNLILIANDRESPEWETAAAQWEDCARHSGLRTDNLPSEAEQMARAMTASMADATTSPPPPAPSAVELGKLLEAEMTNRALQSTRDYVEDRRYPPPRAVLVQKRAYMVVPRVRDLLG